MERYREVEHTADLAANVYGKTLEQLFENAAYAMFDLMTDLEHLKCEKKYKFSVSGEDKEDLLVSFLNELLYISDQNNTIFSAFKVLFTGENTMEAEAGGAAIPQDGCSEKKEIKAATYHDIKIACDNGVYSVLIVFDI